MSEKDQEIVLGLVALKVAAVQLREHLDNNLADKLGVVERMADDIGLRTGLLVQVNAHVNDILSELSDESA